MGVRIDIYAVDVTLLGQLLARPLNEILSHYCVNGTVDGRDLQFHFDSPPKSESFSCRPGGSFRRLVWHNSDLETDELLGSISGFPALTITAREYYSQRSAVSYSGFLEAMSHCHGIDGVTTLSIGYRRWWIGSLLDYLDRSKIVSTEDFHFYADLFSRFLGPYLSGKDLPKNSWKISPEDRMFVPVCDELESIGIWSDVETKLVLELIHQLLDLKPLYKKPSKNVGIAPKDDIDWTDWVETMLKSFLKLEMLSYKNLRIMTYIG